MDSQARPFVDLGGSQTYPQPYSIQGARFYSFLLDADYAALQAYIDRVLNAPAGGKVVYKPLVGRVMLGLMEAARIYAGSPKDATFWIPERDLAFWIPVVKTHHFGPIEIATRIDWYMSYVTVDDPWAVACGREIYGFPKELGVFDQEPPIGPGGPSSSLLTRLAVATQTVVEFGPDARAMPRPLVEIRRTGEPPTAGERAWGTLGEAAREFLGVFLGGHHVTIPGLGVVGEVLEFLEHHDYPLIFLKQFRDIVDGHLACYQAVLEAPAKVTAFRKAAWLPGRYEVSITPYASHPIVADLGLGGATPPVVAAAYLDFDIRIEAGSVITGDLGTLSPGPRASSSPPRGAGGR